MPTLATLYAYAQAVISYPNNYPNKPVRISIGSASGGGAHIMARAAAQRLTERLGKSFVVNNRAGANGIISIDCWRRPQPMAMWEQFVKSSGVKF